MLEVDPPEPDPVKATVWVYSSGDPGSTIVEPRDAARSAGGLTLIADSGGSQVAAVGYDATRLVVSDSVDCGLPGVVRRVGTDGGRGVRLRNFLGLPLDAEDLLLPAFEYVAKNGS